jgi:16S rRNA (cytosine967-C5)-methyltransferase
MVELRPREARRRAALYVIIRHPEFSVVPPEQTTGVLWDKAEDFAAATLQSPEGLLMTPRRTGTDGFFVSVLRRGSS